LAPLQVETVEAVEAVEVTEEDVEAAEEEEEEVVVAAEGDDIEGAEQQPEDEDELECRREGCEDELTIDGEETLDMETRVALLGGVINETCCRWRTLVTPVE